MFENGLYIQFYGEINFEMSKMIHTDKLYTNVNELKDDFTKVNNMDCDYFANLFIICICCYAGQFLLFIIRILFGKIKRLKLNWNVFRFDVRIRFNFKCPAFKIR